MRRTVMFGGLFLIFLVCWILQPLQFLLGGVYPTAAIVFLILALASVFWPALMQVWDWIDEKLGSVAVCLVLFAIFLGASLIVWPVEQALATWYRILAGVSLAVLILSLGIRFAKAAGVTWTYKSLAPFRTTRRREALTGILFIAPWAFGFLAFSAVPIGLSLYVSFTHWTLTSLPQWTGITNYRFMLEDDPTFRIALENTLWYVVVKVPVTIIASLLLALLMAQKVPGIKFFRTIFYMPTVITGVAAIFLWVWVLWPTGLLNTALQPLQNFANWVTFGHWHTAPILWFFNPQWTKPAMVIMSLWYIGGGSLILLASLVGIPRSLYEAADVEGAGVFRKFWSITIPMISPTLFFLILTNIIGAFQVFNSAYVISTASGVGTNPGDPNQSLLFYEVYMFTKFTALNMGYACAMAWVVFLIIMFITAVQLYLSRRWVYYESG
jgi:multiple sugar transport system permease protein